MSNGAESKMNDVHHQQRMYRKLREELSEKDRQAPNAENGRLSAIHKRFMQSSNNGGDADRVLHPKPTTHHSLRPCKMHTTNDNFTLKQYETNVKPSASTLISNANSREYHKTVPTGDIIDLYEHDFCNSSENSSSTRKTVKVLKSCRSSHELRKLLSSQCKLTETIYETINKMCNTNIPTELGNSSCRLKNSQHQLPQSPCKRCSDRTHNVPSHCDVMTEIDKPKLLGTENTVTISIDDVINSRVVNPMIHKLHRMYLNNLKEEMSLMEDLEDLPKKLNEMYKTTTFKPKE